MRPPWLESWAARIGIGVLVLLSIWVGFSYWWTRDQPLAWLTLGAELVAFAGLGVGVWQWKRNWLLGAGAIGVTLIAAAWCALTMFQNIETHSRQEAERAAMERPQYRFASSAADTAQRLLNDRLNHPNPRPECACPQTIASWEAAEAASIDRLRAERDTAVAQMEAALPVPERDWFALARGIGVELAKLFGFLVFALSFAPARREAKHSTIPQPPQPLDLAEVAPPTTATTIARPRQPPRKPEWLKDWLSLETLGKAATVGVAAHVTQPGLDHSATASTTPLDRPVEVVVERNAAPIWRSDLSKVANELAPTMGERRIAAHMTTRYGEKISRHQVRIWLGRESSHA